MSAGSSITDLREALAGRGFRRLLATRVTGQFADGVITVALTSYVFFSPERQSTAADAAATFAVLLLPYSIVGPFAGVLLDRWRRRQVLALANLLRAALVIGVATLVASGVDGVLFYVTGLAVLSVNRFILAALSAALPHVVEARDLVVANALSTTSGTIAAGIGGGVGFAVRSIAGDGDGVDAAICLIAATAYVLASGLATRLGRDELGPDERPGPASDALRDIGRGMVAGARHVRQRKPAARALGVIGVHRFFYGISTISVLLLYRNYFNAPADTTAAIAGLGLTVAASVAGYLAAAIVTPPVVRRIGTKRWIVAVIAAAAGVEVTYVVLLTELTVVVGAFLLGIVAQGAKICVDTIVQENVDDAFRGRVFSFYDVLFNVSFVGAAAVAAIVVPQSGYSPLLYGAIAAGYAGTALWYGRSRNGYARDHP